MNTLIVYASAFGNTKALAERMASAFPPDESVSLIWLDKRGQIDLEPIDLLIIGCPTQHHTMPLAMLHFLRHLPYGMLNNRPAAVFDTRYNMPRWLSGSAGVNVAKMLGERGAWLVVPPMSFFVSEREGPLKAGELDRAAAWAHRIIRRLEIFTPQSPDSIRLAVTQHG